MTRLEIEIQGMTCDGCARHVEHALEQAGAGEPDVDWRRGSAVVSHGDVDERAFEEALAGTRYSVRRIVRRDGEPPSANDGAAYDYDLIVLGSGGASFAAAIRARDLGRRVLLVEHGTIGGTCVNVGCVPSKSLLADSERAHRTGAPLLADAVARKAALVGQLRQEKYIGLLDAYGIELREEQATLAGPHGVAVDGETLTAGAILVATGARPAVPAIDGLEESGYLTSTSALEVTEAPRRLAVIGANAVGLELGQAFGNFGSQVTFLDVARVTPFEEPEVSEAIRGVLEDDGHTVIEGARTERVRIEGGEKVLAGRHAGERFELRVDEILVATSRVPNTDDLGLETVGVETDGRGAVVVDSRQRTSVPSIWAAGDVTSQPQFVYVAAAGGAAAAENALGAGDERLDFGALPRIIFTTPTIAGAGLTEAQAREQGLQVESRVLPLEAVPRALVNGNTRGLVKLVAEAGSGRLLGASIVADGAGEVIQSAVLAIDRDMTVGELASTWAPYLTMAEALKLAAQTFTRDVARLSCCAA
ncbi:MAG: mercury(II) reductase [Solirubrobacteraceae bacterium]